MSYRIHITSAAERNLNHAVDHIEFVLKNPKAAVDLLDKAEKQINSLSEFLENSSWLMIRFFHHGVSALLS